MSGDSTSDLPEREASSDLDHADAARQISGITIWHSNVAQARKLKAEQTIREDARLYLQSDEKKKCSNSHNALCAELTSVASA